MSIFKQSTCCTQILLIYSSFNFSAPPSMSYWFLCCYISGRSKLAVRQVFAKHYKKKNIYFSNNFLKKSLFFFLLETRGFGVTSCSKPYKHVHINFIFVLIAVLSHFNYILQLLQIYRFCEITKQDKKNTKSISHYDG